MADDGPGITRRRSGDGFEYLDTDGRRITDPRVIQRINALAIPPAYESVWICPHEMGHIQATARDARGRKQYRYHSQWKDLRDASKYDRLVEFGKALPRIRRRVERDMSCKGISSEKVVAVVVYLLEVTLIRVGSRRYVQSNKSYGLTTLRRRHTTIEGSRVRFRFKGKSGVPHDVTVNDRRVASMIRRCMEIPGQELFQYQNSDGSIETVDSGAVNDYLKEAGGGDFTAKHYRTWAASVFAMNQLQQCRADSPTSARRMLNEVVKSTAKLLGNTPSVCRECYIHPAVLQTYLEGTLPALESVRTPKGLNADERRFFAFLQSVDALARVSEDEEQETPRA
ncbi:DNA topoisomerase IB [Candidimonas sp. SYP-B2681]|uniref:DNA topoisomerase IB n=1 Tax=Candidimonas sp. SYP-B2681 TaxID=2497686 RepID=UPI001F3F7320|nr:DNA topoisomerase IB [Candidimonas sp. SYP-B2681]